VKPANPTAVVASQHATQEELDARHANDLPGGQIPVTWQDGATGHKMKGRPLTVLPDQHDVEVFGRQNAATCGQCKFYDLEGGRKEIVKSRFAETLVREHKWKLHHLGDVESLGICRERPTMAVTYVSGACESFRPRQLKRR